MSELITTDRIRMSRTQRFLVVAISVCVLFIVADFATVIGFSVIRPTAPAHVDAVIVLGAKVGTPALTHRTIKGLYYYQTGQTNTIVVSGARGSDEPVSEAAAMKAVITKTLAGTDMAAPTIMSEDRSANTLQNIKNSRQLIPNAKSVVIVSDSYHLARAVMMARYAGFEHVYWAAPPPTYYSTLDLMHYYVREAIALPIYATKLLFT